MRRMLALSVLPACGGPDPAPALPLDRTDVFGFAELSLSGQIRASEVELQAALAVSASGAPRDLGGGDELWLLAPSGERRRFTSYETLLLAALPADQVGEGTLEILMTRGDLESRIPVTLPRAFSLEVTEREHGVQRISWEPIAESAMSVYVDALCLSHPVERYLLFDQGFIDIQPADLSFVDEPCALSASVYRAAPSGPFSVEQIRTVALSPDIGGSP